MNTLILCSSRFPGKDEEPFLRIEFPFLEKKFEKVYIDINEAVLYLGDGYNLLPQVKDKTPISVLIKQNWLLLFNAWFTELIKSPKRLHYLQNYKKYLSIWMGWLQEAKAWEELLKQFNPDDTVIYTYWYEQQANALTVLRAQGKLPFKWVSRAHGWDVDKRQRIEGLIPFRHWMLKHAPDNLVSISDFGKDIFKSDYGALAQVARLGTPDLGLAPIPKDSNSLTIVSIAALVPLKRVHLIIEILCKVKAKITWIHYGDGPMAELLTWSSLPQNVELQRKGHIDHEILLQELKNTPIDLMLHVSEFEGIPVSIMECMSMGIPVMACDAGGVSEIVDNENGWLLPVEIDTTQIAETIDGLAEDKSQLISKRKMARQKWEDEYQAKVNFPDFIQTYLSHHNI